MKYQLKTTAPDYGTDWFTCRFTRDVTEYRKGRRDASFLMEKKTMELKNYAKKHAGVDVRIIKNNKKSSPYLNNIMIK